MVADDVVELHIARASQLDVEIVGVEQMPTVEIAGAFQHDAKEVGRRDIDGHAVGRVKVDDAAGAVHADHQLIALHPRLHLFDNVFGSLHTHGERVGLHILHV